MTVDELGLQLVWYIGSFDSTCRTSASDVGPMVLLPLIRA